MHLKAAVHSLQLHDFSAGKEQVGEAVLSGAELLFQLQDMLGRIDGFPEFRLQESAQLRLAQLGGERKVVVPALLVPVVQVLLVDDADIPLQKTVYRQPPEAGQPVFQADFPVPVQSVAFIKVCSGGLDDFIRRHARIKLQFAFFRLRAHPLKDGAPAELGLEQNRLQRVPEVAFIHGRVFVPVQRPEQLFQLFVFIVLPRRAEDDVPVEVHVAVGVIGLEVRHKGIVLCAVPYDVVRAPFLKVCDVVLLHGLQGAF